jgi:hypothetical protein
MKRKLGPLQLWQWILIGALVGGGTLLYRRGHPAALAAADAASAALPSDAAYNPIDPTTGLPFAGGISAGALGPTDTSSDVLSPQDQFAGYLSNLESLMSLVAPVDAGTGDAVATDPAVVQTQVGTSKAKKKPAKKKPAKKKKTTHAGNSNPGHHVTKHGAGKKTPSSSAPHNRQQHKNVAPPSHQRHPATKHHSAGHLQARKGAGRGNVPTVHPPAKKPRARRRRRRG